MVHVKQEPSLLPGLDPPPSFGQEAGAASRRQPQVRAAGHSVTQRLHVGPEVKVWREEEGQAALREGLLWSHDKHLIVWDYDAGLFGLKTFVVLLLKLVVCRS